MTEPILPQRRILVEMDGIKLVSFLSEDCSGETVQEANLREVIFGRSLER